MAGFASVNQCALEQSDWSFTHSRSGIDFAPLAVAEIAAMARSIYASFCSICGAAYRPTANIAGLVLRESDLDL
jgi:hypothetical protein